MNLLRFQASNGKLTFKIIIFYYIRKFKISLLALEQLKGALVISDCTNLLHVWLKAVK